MGYLNNIFENQRKIIFLLMILVILNLFIFSAIFGFHATSDTDSFLMAIDFFKGKSDIIYPNRYLNPFYAVVASQILPFLNSAQSIVVINIIFYTGLIFLTYGLVRRVFKNNTTGFIAALLVITAYPILRYGLLQVQDMGGYFWFVLTIYAAWRWYEDKNWRWLAIGSISTAFGVLTKESGCMGALFAGLILLTEQGIRVRKKIALILGFALLPFITIVINALRGHDVGYSSARWFIENWQVYAPGNYTIVKWLGVNLTTYNIAWIFIIYGLYLLVKNRKSINPDIKKYLVLVIPSSASYFAWPMFIGRTVFISAWFFIPIAAFALSSLIDSHKKNKLIGICSVVLCVIAPYILQYIIAYAPLFSILEVCHYNPVCSAQYFVAHWHEFSRTGVYSAPLVP